MKGEIKLWSVMHQQVLIWTELSQLGQEDGALNTTSTIFAGKFPTSPTPPREAVTLGRMQFLKKASAVSSQ
jgi:hypothetical protein